MLCIPKLTSSAFTDFTLIYCDSFGIQWEMWHTLTDGNDDALNNHSTSIGDGTGTVENMAIRLLASLCSGVYF